MKPKLPSIVRRGLAYAFDLALLMVVWFAVVKKEFAVSADWKYEFGETVSNFEYLNPGNALLFLGALVLYGTLAEAAMGRTIGKFLVGVKVVARDGRAAGAKEAALRNILKPVDAALLGAPVLLSERNLSLGDRLAGTAVVGKGGEGLPDPVAVSVGRKIFAAIFVAAFVAAVVGTLRAVPEITSANSAVREFMRTAQDAASRREYAAFHGQLAPELQAQMPLEKMSELFVEGRLGELVSALRVDSLRFSAWSFAGNRALVRGGDGVSEVELLLERADRLPGWKILRIEVNNPTIE